ncbi:monovalent cation/H(+) antiporter subunit G [Pontibacter litorisediminis]|uniref:monovalent cation/H(+) antiporter subunit G n=1 Tax=Pontibacter litorisediminis TaxID=1846260 RepID=UPI0023EB0305|nr:monovalent cation/H(+) antiporter subunit G [Pontibacter litorisediminis]
MATTIDWVLIKELVSCFFILLGVVFMLIAAIGLLRFPDFYIRMSAITKGATLGLGLILMGMAIYFNQPGILLKVLAIIVFTSITTPVAAHVIGRTAVQNGIPFWGRTKLDEFNNYILKELLERKASHDKYTVEVKKEKPETGGGAGNV